MPEWRPGEEAPPPKLTLSQQLVEVRATLDAVSKRLKTIAVEIRAKEKP